ncbi:hypothetical protein A2U01_0115180, partial [Trifolium medium]|nr:hypothetical protein [Trifolium medium]
RFLSLQRGTFRFLRVSVAFSRWSEGLSDVPSRSVDGSRPASLSGQDLMFWLCVGFGSEYGLVILAA